MSNSPSEAFAKQLIEHLKKEGLIIIGHCGQCRHFRRYKRKGTKLGRCTFWDEPRWQDYGCISFDKKRVE